MSRPSKWTDEDFDKILERITHGKSVFAVTKADDVPAITQFYEWLAKSDTNKEKYARALEMRADRHAEEIIEIADDSSGDYGFKEGEDESGQTAKPVFLSENVQRSKLRVDARKWTAARMNPRKYGDFQRNEISGKDGGPIQLSIADQIRSAHGD